MILDLYFEAGRQPLSQDDERVIRLSNEIGHSQRSVHLKMANFQWFDPERIGGLDGGSRQTWEVWYRRTGSGVNAPPIGSHRYSRDDDIMVLEMYFDAGRQPLPERDIRVFELSNFIGTSPKSIHRRMATYQWLDPERVGGIETVARQSKEVWNAFADDQKRLRKAADRCRRKSR
ncbi:MAG: hypothetical protein F4Y49_07875 [Dehalococcoidia bacterium]|nr:hypothetical protein [Dehalococcoidia bacterium]